MKIISHTSSMYQIIDGEFYRGGGVKSDPNADFRQQGLEVMYDPEKDELMLTMRPNNGNIAANLTRTKEHLGEPGRFFIINVYALM